MIEVHMQLLNVPALLARIDKQPYVVAERAVALVNHATLESQRVAKVYTPVRTGKLRAGNKIHYAAATNWIIMAELYNDVYYAVYVVFGTYKMRARDFFTPAIEYGRQILAEKGAEILTWA